MADQVLNHLTKAFGLANVQEAVFKTSNIDAPSHTIKGVALLGSTSLNGRLYTQKALASAVIQFNGKPAYYHHRDRWARNIKNDLIGYFSDLAIEGQTVKGTLNVLPSEWDKMSYIALHMASRYGFSIDATTKYYITGGVEHIDEIIDAKSVDLVEGPATVKGVFEEEHSMDEEKKDVSEVVVLTEQIKKLTMSLQEQTATVVSQERTIKSLTEELHREKVGTLIEKHGISVPKSVLEVLMSMPLERAEGFLQDLKEVGEQYLPSQRGSLSTLFRPTIGVDDLKKEFTKGV